MVPMPPDPRPERADPPERDLQTAPTLGLYVHVPFCEVKCTYCHFAIDPGRPAASRQDRYVAAVLDEMGQRRGEAEGAVADTLYFGGGTPSLLAAQRVARIVGAARSHYRLAPDAEITIEANPRDLDERGYRELRRVGATRLSLGLQSMDDGVLREMGRIHGAADSVEAVSWARGAGFDNVSIDLILGWPGESASRWTPTLDAALDLAPDHVSLYVLEVDGRNVLSHRAARGRLFLPPDDLVADLYETTIERLEAAGLRHYEISNWAKPGFESRHNAKYWADEPFLGFGLSAHSYSGGVRSWNHATLGRYCDSMEKTGAARAGSRALGPRERVADALFTGLRRRDGIGLAAFRDRYGVDAVEAYGDSLREAFSAGLLEADADRMRLTRRGLLVSNEVFRALV